MPDLFGHQSYKFTNFCLNPNQTDMSLKIICVLQGVYIVFERHFCALSDILSDRAGGGCRGKREVSGGVSTLGHI